VHESAERFEIKKILDHTALKTTKMFETGKFTIPESLRAILLPHNLNLIPLSGVTAVGFFSGKFSVQWVCDSLISLVSLGILPMALFQLIDITLSLVMFILSLLFLRKVYNSYISVKIQFEMGYPKAIFLRESASPYLWLATFYCLNQLARLFLQHAS
jgi:hypothetical protein